MDRGWHAFTPRDASAPAGEETTTCHPGSARPAAARRCRAAAAALLQLGPTTAAMVRSRLYRPGGPARPKSSRSAPAWPRAPGAPRPHAPRRHALASAAARGARRALALTQPFQASDLRQRPQAPAAPPLAQTAPRGPATPRISPAANGGRATIGVIVQPTLTYPYDIMQMAPPPGATHARAISHVCLPGRTSSPWDRPRALACERGERTAIRPLDPMYMGDGA